MVLILNMYFLAHILPLGMLALAQWALIVFAILILRTHCDPGTSPGMDLVFLVLEAYCLLAYLTAIPDVKLHRSMLIQTRTYEKFSLQVFSYFQHVTLELSL